MVSDSAYVAGGVAAGYCRQSNKDLWKMLRNGVARLEQGGAKVTFVKVKAHTERREYIELQEGDNLQTRLDTLGNAQADALRAKGPGAWLYLGPWCWRRRAKLAMMLLQRFANRAPRSERKGASGRGPEREAARIGAPFRTVR